MCIKSYIILITLLILISVSATAQITITGTVSNSNKESIVGANVMLGNKSRGVLTDKNGGFSISTKTKKDTLLKISFVGYKPIQMRLNFQKDTDLGTIILQTNVQQLSEVTVNASKTIAEKKQQAIVVDVLDLKTAQVKASSLPQLLNLTSGVKVRQTGGKGSETSININGMQGKAIRFFKDNIPVDYLGNAFNLSLIPTANLDQIEVYKGVLPTELGADALGGGVNFISKQSSKNQANIAYTYGSFKAHELSLNVTHFIVPEKVYVSTSSYYTSAANNYKVNAKIVNPDTRNLEEVSVRRFHDGVSSMYLSGKVGVLSKKYFDNAELEVGYLNYQSDLQHNIYMSRPYGEAEMKEKLIQTNLKLTKKVENKFGWQVFTAYSIDKNYVIDTTHNKYNWLGQIDRVTSTAGELSNIPTNQLIRYENIYGLVNANYYLHPNHNLQFSHVSTISNRSGNNPPGQKIVNTDIDPLTIPAHYTKQVSGLGLKSELFAKKLTHLFTIKRYSIETSGVDINWSYDQNAKTNTNTNMGIASSWKYNIKPTMFVRVSYENSTRIPDATEFFGDGFAVLGNLELKPERSNNVNVGFRGYISEQKSNKIDVNLYYRGQKNLVILIPWLPFARYENWAEVGVKGIELQNSGRLYKNLKYTANLTFQDIRRAGVSDQNESSLLGSRVPNIPFLFGNVALDYSRVNVVKKGDFINFYGSYAYTHTYYLFAIPKSLEPENIFSSAGIDSDLLIPSQSIVDFGITYGLGNTPLQINTEVNNILNATLYDKFRVQKPGINFKIKLTYNLNN